MPLSQHQRTPSTDIVDISRTSGEHAGIPLYTGCPVCRAPVLVQEMLAQAMREVALNTIALLEEGLSPQGTIVALEALVADAAATERAIGSRSPRFRLAMG